MVSMRQWVQRAHSQYLHLWIEFGGRRMGDTPFLNLRPTLACLTLNWMHTDTAADTCGSIAYMSRQHVLTDVLALTDLRIFVSYSHSCILLSININHIFHKLAVVFFFFVCLFFLAFWIIAYTLISHNSCFITLCCRETLGPGTHVDASWDTPLTQKPLQTKYTPSW